MEGSLVSSDGVYRDVCMSIDASITQSGAFDGWRAPSFNERCTFLFFFFLVWRIVRDWKMVDTDVIFSLEGYLD